MSSIGHLILDALDELEHDDFKRFKMSLTKTMAPDFEPIPRKNLEEAKQNGVMELMVNQYGESDAVENTVKVLKQMKKNKLASDLEKELKSKVSGVSETTTDSRVAAGPSSSTEDVTKESVISVCQQKFKPNLGAQNGRISEGIPKHGSSKDLNQIYTKIDITKGWSEDASEITDFFKDKSIRIVLTKGVAGIGKTVSVQKFIVDWAEGKANEDITFIFPLPFSKLNKMEQENLSLMNLLHHFFPEIRKVELLDCDSYKVVFIFDGLDECRLPLDFQDNERLCDVTQLALVDVLLTNLITGNLLRSAFLWITSRPGAVNLIPPEYIDQVTEVRGFSNAQKEEYFRKRISDQHLANKIITHVTSSRSLHIMCQIPVFCWIIATKAESGEIPKTLTQMFTRFLIFQIKHKYQKYHQICDYPDPKQIRESILALGKLAFYQLEKGNLIFYEEDLRECGIDVREVSVYSGVCTQIFSEESVFDLVKKFSFVHHSVQEFLAALYAFICFIDEKRNLLVEQSSGTPNMSDFLRSAVDKALQSENGHLDLFPCFLLGLSLKSNQTLLRGIMPQTESSRHSTQETVNYIKEKIKESPEKSFNLSHCLNELNDHSLVQKVQAFLNRGRDRCLSEIRHINVTVAAKKTKQATATGGWSPTEDLTTAEELALSLNRGRPQVEGIEGGLSTEIIPAGVREKYVQVTGDDVVLLDPPATFVQDTLDPCFDGPSTSRDVDEETVSADTDIQEDVTTPRSPSAKSEDVHAVYKRKLEELDIEYRKHLIKKTKLEIKKLQIELQKKDD